MNAPNEPKNETSTSTGGFSVKRVLVAVVWLVFVSGLAFGAVMYWNNLELQIVKVTGRVTWNGNPVTIGAVMTRHAEDALLPGIGGLDKEGRFELSTNAVQGAAVGKHKVVVASYGAGMGTTPLVPAAYLKFDTTPFTIDVSSDPQKNHFELEIVGEPLKSSNEDGSREKGMQRPPAEGTDQDAGKAEETDLTPQPIEAPETSPKE
jgi:hypothetical protein